MLHIEKKMRVSYSSPVWACVRRLRVFPPQTTCEKWHCYPQPNSAREWADDFGNRVLEVCHAKIEGEFLFESECETSSSYEFNSLPATGLGAFLLPSALCDLNDEIRAAAAPFSQVPKDELGLELCAWTHHALVYDPTVSGIETTASQSLRREAGVCQDFAHLMIALCRALAVPSRYVSGYALGEGRMHAWVEVLINGEWHAFDPTHNRTVENAVRVAIGRDFRDANPHEGTFRGRARAVLESGCRVRAK
jgi:transglutaminase-like putative cysteine protease